LATASKQAEPSKPHPSKTSLSSESVCGAKKVTGKKKKLLKNKFHDSSKEIHIEEVQ